MAVGFGHNLYYMYTLPRHVYLMAYQIFTLLVTEKTIVLFPSPDECVNLSVN